MLRLVSGWDWIRFDKGYYVLLGLLLWCLLFVCLGGLG